MIVTILGALLLGAGIGVLTGLFGVGGGFLMTPLLSIVLGLPMPIAVGTGAAQILGISSAGLYRRYREGNTDYKMAIVLFGGNYVGVRLGADTLRWLGSLGTWRLGGQPVLAVDLIILIVFLFILTAITAWLLYDTSRPRAEGVVQQGLLSRLALPPYTEFHTLDRPRMSIIALAYLGLFLGFLTGLLGIGGGVVLVPALLYLVGMRMQRASATSLAMVWLTSFLATITHATRGNVDLLLVIPLLIGGSLGLQLGVGLCPRLGGRALQRYFSLVVLVAALMVAGKLAALLF